jgi:hypothetical protein
MTVPVAAEGVSARPTGRQCRTLAAYMSRSTGLSVVGLAESAHGRGGVAWIVAGSVTPIE